MTTAILTRQARAGLGERFPVLRTDDARWAKVQAEARDLYNARVTRLPNVTPEQKLAMMDSALSDGARIHVGDPLSAQERTDRKAARAARGDGQPTKAIVQAPASHKTPKTTEDLDDMWMNAKEEGNEREMKRIEQMYETGRFG